MSPAFPSRRSARTLASCGDTPPHPRAAPRSSLAPRLLHKRIARRPAHRRRCRSRRTARRACRRRRFRRRRRRHRHRRRHLHRCRRRLHRLLRSRRRRRSYRQRPSGHPYRSQRCRRRHRHNLRAPRAKHTILLPPGVLHPGEECSFASFPLFLFTWRLPLPQSRLISPVVERSMRFPWHRLFRVEVHGNPSRAKGNLHPELATLCAGKARFAGCPGVGGAVGRRGC